MLSGGEHAWGILFMYVMYFCKFVMNSFLACRIRNAKLPHTSALHWRSHKYKYKYINTCTLFVPSMLHIYWRDCSSHNRRTTIHLTGKESKVGESRESKGKVPPPQVGKHRLIVNVY